MMVKKITIIYTGVYIYFNQVGGIQLLLIFSVRCYVRYEKFNFFGLPKFTFRSAKQPTTFLLLVL